MASKLIGSDKENVPVSGPSGDGNVRPDTDGAVGNVGLGNLDNSASKLLETPIVAETNTPEFDDSDDTFMTLVAQVKVLSS